MYIKNMNNPSKPKIAIIGAGAVGSLIGGLLADKGESITLIAKKEHYEAIKKSGLIIDGDIKALTVRLDAREKLDFQPDIIFICVKTQDLEEACKSIIQYAAKALIVTFQNGIHSDEIASTVLKTKRIVGAIVLFNAQYYEAGKVIYGAEAPLVIGDSFNANPDDMENIKEVLGRSFRIRSAEDLKAARYMKLIVNVLANSLGALTGQSAYDFMKYRSARKLGACLFRETWRTFKAAEIKTEAIPGYTVENFDKLDSLPLFMIASILGKRSRKSRFSKTVASTPQSLKRGKTSEVEAINGEIVRLAESAGKQAFFNQKVIDCCRRIEKTGSFMSARDIRKEFFGGKGEM